MTLNGKIIFITGATSGFGHAMATQFAQSGAKIIATGRRADRLYEFKASLKDKLHAITADVSDKNVMQKAIESLPKEFANVDVLVNNAGLALGFDPAPNTKLEQWEQMIDTNIKGVLYCTHMLLPGMVERDSGHIVNIGSIAGTYPYPGGNVYGSTKAFLKQFSLNLRADLLGKNIRVTDIEPGTMNPEDLSKALVLNHHQAEKFTHYLEINPDGLNVIKGRSGVYVIPNEVPLDLNNRIISSGKVSDQ